MGLGLTGARRLMDRFRIETAAGKGTLVELEQIIPKRAGRITKTKLSDVAAALKRDSAADPLEALREQNRELLQSLGVGPEPALARACSDAIKARLRAATAEAESRGVFGAPTFICADGELFWGHDRMAEALAWAVRR